MLLELLTPHLQVPSVLEIQVPLLQQHGVTGLLVDVDCTLKDYYADRFREEIVDWVRTVTGSRVPICLLSNGRDRRIRLLAAYLDLPHVAGAAKPFTWGLRRGIGKLGLEPHQVGVIGDQVFADVLAGRLAGLFTILVRPTTTQEPWITHIKRPLERWVLKKIASRNSRGRSGAGEHGA